MFYLLKKTDASTNDQQQSLEAMKRDAEYATMEALEAFIMGWGMVSSAYLTVHKLSPKIVTSDAYENQVATARTEIMDASNVCYQAQHKYVLESN